MGDYRDLVFYQKAREVVKGINTREEAHPYIVEARPSDE
jgi:hypothetical protein